VGDDYLVSPITGEKIPASKVQEHMRIGLLDPRWVEQRDKHVTDKVSVEKHTYCSRGVSLPVRHEGYVIYNHINQIKFSSTNLLCSYYRKVRV